MGEDYLFPEEYFVPCAFLKLQNGRY